MAEPALPFCGSVLVCEATQDLRRAWEMGAPAVTDAEYDRLRARCQADMGFYGVDAEDSRRRDQIVDRFGGHCHLMEQRRAASPTRGRAASPARGRARSRSRSRSRDRVHSPTRDRRQERAQSPFARQGEVKSFSYPD
jgi:hypothetical protein